MKFSQSLCVLALILLNATAFAQEQDGQSVQPATSGSVVPALIKFSGILREFDNSPHTSFSTVTFSIFKNVEGGSAVWSETQNVQPDSTGRFTVLLGKTQPAGLPKEVFASGDARWIEITAPGLPTPPRTALISVPYALKAGDAETLGGRPLSDFVLVPQPSTPCQACVRLSQLTLGGVPIGVPLPVTATRFESTSSTGPSFVSDAQSGPAFQIQSTALETNLNADLLHGFTDAAFAKLSSSNAFTASEQFAGGFTLPAINQESNNPNLTDSASADFASSIYDPNSGTLQKQLFRWTSSPNPTSGASGAILSLSYGANDSTPSPTGFAFNSDGTVTFAANQQFPTASIVAAVNGTTNSNDPSVAPIVYTAPYKWQEQPQTQSGGGASGIQLGWNSIQLSPCPQGVNGTDAWHYLFISGTGTPEVVLISGGTCVSGAKSGTIEFTAAYAHPAGYTIGSATAGLQEAINAAILPNTNGQSARSVTINPGEYLLQARLSVRASGIHITGYGATITCAVQDTCIMLGDPSNSNMFTRIMLEGISVQPAIQNGTFSAIEDNANGTQLESISSTQGTNSAFSFGYIIQVDNDQAASMDRIDTAGTSTIRCDSGFCGAIVYAPGPFATNAAVGWLTNSNLSPQCRANGVDWQSGNTLQIENAVIQGYAQFGIRAGTARGGYGNLQMDNVYEEVGNCANPAGNIGQAGVIAQGGTVHITGGMGPAGELPCYSTGCSGNLTRYYIVAQNSSYGASNPLGAGVGLMTDTSTLVSWPEIPGATSYDLIATDNNAAWYSGNSPTGTGSFAVAVGISPSSCSNNVCTFVDNHAPRISYSLNTPTYFPLLKYWPGPIVLGSSSDSGSVYAASTLQADVVSAAVIAEQGTLRTAVTAQSCDSASAVSPVWMQCEGSPTPPSSLYQQQATIMLVKPNNDGNLATNLKGRLNFGTLGTGPSHIITLSDSNFAKTIAAADNRPNNDPNDAFIGYDRGQGDPAQIGISFGAPTSLSNYIGNVGDGASWLERLTSTMKQFKVPVQTTAVVVAQLQACTSQTEGAMQAVSDSTTNAWGATIGGGGSSHVLAYCDGTDWTVAAK